MNSKYKIYYHSEPDKIKIENVKHLLNKKTLSSSEQRILNWFYYHPQGLRLCSRCCKIKKADNENFYLKRYFKDKNGNILNYGLSGKCKECDKKRAKKYKKQQRNNPFLYCKRIIPSLKHRSKIKNIPFKLNVNELFLMLEKQQYKCYYTGELLNFKMKSTNSKFPHRLMPSVDRKDPKKGYTSDNVVWCCYYVNRMKRNLLFYAQKY